jgi:DNA repair exonuclease SbcCD ATPase subunit
MSNTMNTINPNTPDQIQAAADKLQMELNITTTQEDMDAIRSVMRELVAREQLKDIHAVADLREENTRLRERVAELEKDNETLRRGARIAFDQEDHAEKCVESLETQLAAMTKERDDLAKENARIIANHGCARNQGTTQFCAEVLSVQKERDELRQHADALARALEHYENVICVGGRMYAHEALAAYRASQQPKT